MLDEPKPIRAGEELNVEALQAYLSELVPSLKGEIIVKQFPSGFSNLTYLLTIGEKEYVLRRPPFGANIKSAHDMEREFRVLKAVKKAYPNVPEPVHYCANEQIVGAEFYIMERVTGVILRQKAPKGLTLTTALMKNLSEATVDNLAAIHSINIKKSGLHEIGRPDGYVERQVEGWIGRYKNAETDHIPNMELAAEWMRSNMPTEYDVTLIHNDYKYDNLVLNPNDFSDIKAVLDWEMATVGDPMMDLGTSLAYWAEEDTPAALKTFSLTHLPGNLNRQEILERYAEKTGRSIEHGVFYYVYGCYKVGVICQQIYARYQKGLTKDARFALLLFVVQACAENAANAIKFGRVNRFQY